MKIKYFVFFSATAFLFLTSLLISCNKEKSDASIVPNGKSELAIMLTDDPSIMFDSIFIDIQQVEVKVEDSTGIEHWDNITIRKGVYNILRFKNGLDTLLGVGYVPKGEIEKIRITIGNNNYIIANGVTVPLTNLENKIIINVKGDVDEVDDNHKRIWLDFDGFGSIKFKNGKPELRLKIGHFGRHNSADIEGKIKPSAAFPVMVLAVSGTDTLRSVPEREGEFKIKGIKTNTVKIIIKPSNGYKDSIINNVAIKLNDDINLGNIVLHK
jgi:Domain of unknown function (DUF4382)